MFEMNLEEAKEIALEHSDGRTIFCIAETDTSWIFTFDTDPEDPKIDNDAWIDKETGEYLGPYNPFLKR